MNKPSDYSECYGKACQYGCGVAPKAFASGCGQQYTKSCRKEEYRQGTNLSSSAQTLL